jgi:hypothetical protein
MTYDKLPVEIQSEKEVIGVAHKKSGVIDFYMVLSVTENNQIFFRYGVQNDNIFTWSNHYFFETYNKAVKFFYHPEGFDYILDAF